MVIEIDVNDKQFDLVRRAYQLESDTDTYSVISGVMEDAVEKLTRDLVECKQCGKAFKKVYKTQEFCCKDCQIVFNEKTQPSLPFEGEEK